MRGSVYYQSAVLTKVIFVEGSKKENKIKTINKATFEWLFYNYFKLFIDLKLYLCYIIKI